MLWLWGGQCNSSGCSALELHIYQEVCLLLSWYQSNLVDKQKISYVFTISGSYFARDAKYSHSYTSQSGVKCMFVSRILVGDYTRGSSSYLRPPSKDGGDTLFYDSCVDSVSSPSIFVVFEKHQIYPEYLIKYDEETNWSHVYQQWYGTVPAAASAPPAPRPAPAPRQAPMVPAPQPTPSSYSPPRQSQSPKKDTCVISWDQMGSTEINYLIDWIRRKYDLQNAGGQHFKLCSLAIFATCKMLFDWACKRDSLRWGSLTIRGIACHARIAFNRFKLLEMIVHGWFKEKLH